MTRGFPIATLALAVALAAASGASAQSLPEGWVAVTHPGEAAAVDFQAMTPGWHLYPGPAALVYRADARVEPPFRIEMEAYRFAGEPSGYGVFVGGRGLEPGAWDFFEVLLDAAGRYRLGHQAATEYHEVAPWTAHEAIAVPTGEETGHNMLAVEADGERFAVFVNGVEVASFEPPDYARFDGVMGIRVLEGANVHVTRLDVEAGAEDSPGR